MAGHSFIPRVEVLAVTDSGRRRRWTAEEKLRIVEESLARPRMASATARRYEISRSLLTRWRREARDGTLGAEAGGMHFTAVALADAPPPRGRGAFDEGLGLRVSMPIEISPEGFSRWLRLPEML